MCDQDWAKLIYGSFISQPCQYNALEYKQCQTNEPYWRQHGLLKGLCKYWKQPLQIDGCHLGVSFWLTALLFLFVHILLFLVIPLVHRTHPVSYSKCVPNKYSKWTEDWENTSSWNKKLGAYSERNLTPQSTQIDLSTWWWKSQHKGAHTAQVSQDVSFSYHQTHS